MQRKISHLTTILAVGLVNIISLPTTVNAQDGNIECRKAIANAKTRLQTIPNVLIEQVWTRNNSDAYANLPQGRPIEYIFYLTGTKRKGNIVETGIKNLENSPQFMKNISQDIISKCGSVSAVTFGSVLAPGCGMTFGLMDDGTIKAFEDVDVPRPLKWGETFCT